MPSPDLVKRIISKFGPRIDIGEQPEILDDLLKEVAAPPSAEPDAGRSEPFGVSWMDSWIAHWIFAERARTMEMRGDEVAKMLRALADLKFEERLHEIRDLIEQRRRPNGGGAPEPGTPGQVFAPPDAGTPSEPGVPLPPDPEPPTGPDGFHIFRENPWILYWFVSIKAPMLLDVVDLHLTRRLEEMMRR